MGAGVLGATKSILGMVGGLLSTIVVSLFVNQRYATFVAKANTDDLNAIRELMTSGRVTTVADRAFDLSETAEAMRYQDQGHARGKVITTVPLNAADEGVGEQGPRGPAKLEPWSTGSRPSLFG